jgi:intracellular sulfur oxidation DsrE/DsrF family protein
MRSSAVAALLGVAGCAGVPRDVRSGVAEITRLQQHEGYAYLRP